MATGELAAAGPAAAQPRSRSGTAYAALIAGVLCISFTAIFTKLAHVPGPVAAAYRMAIATVVLTLPLIWHLRRVGRPRTGLRWGITGGFWFALNLGLLSSALLRTSAANATLLDNTAPIWVGLGALIFFHEKLGRRYWAGLALALAGAAVVSGFRLAGGVSLNAGDVMAFVGAVFYAGYLLNTQRARRDLDSLTYLWLVAATSAVVLVGYCLAAGLPLRGYSPGSYLFLVALGVLTQVGGWLLIIYALGHLPASAAVVVLLAQPVVTGLLSIPLLGEPLGIRQLIGGALLLTGIALCLAGNAKEQSAQRNVKIGPIHEQPAG